MARLLDSGEDPNLKALNVLTNTRKPISARLVEVAELFGRTTSRSGRNRLKDEILPWFFDYLIGEIGGDRHPLRPSGGTGPGSWPIPVAAVVATGSLGADADLVGRVAASVKHPRRVDAATAEWLERCLAEHRRVDDEIGSGPLLGVVRAQLSTVADLAGGASGPITDRLIGLAAQYAQFMAWLCNDAGDKAAALRWYDRAHDWALEAGDVHMAATSLSMKAHLAWSVQDPRRTIRMARAAQVGPLSPGVRGMAVQMEARGHAIAGDPSRARRALDRAETLIARAAASPASEPAWLYFYDEVWFGLQRGMVELDLGEGTKAGQLLVCGLAALPASYRRDRAWYGALLARAHLVAGDLDAACHAAAAVAADAVAVNRYATEVLYEIADRVTAAAPQRGQELHAVLSATST